jgi:hypothetical protein
MGLEGSLQGRPRARGRRRADSVRRRTTIRLPLGVMRVEFLAGLGGEDRRTILGIRPTDLTVGADREAAISGEVFSGPLNPVTYVESTSACARSRRSATRSRRRASATGQSRLSGRPHVPVRPGEQGPALAPVAPTLAFPSPPCLAPAPSRPRSDALRVTFRRPLTFSLYILSDGPCGSWESVRRPNHAARTPRIA